MPQAKHKDYKLKESYPSAGPWWAGFAEAELSVHGGSNTGEAPPRQVSHQPYHIPIASEAVTTPEKARRIAQAAEQANAPRYVTRDRTPRDLGNNPCCC